MTCDNCSRNRLFVSLSGKHFVGCASHRFNLALQEIITEHGTLRNKVNDLMKKLEAPIAAAKVRKCTNLRAKRRNVTRWFSVFEMLKR